jgi:hypothetical protein
LLTYTTRVWYIRVPRYFQWNGIFSLAATK